jgi:hypothetical protein
MKMINGLIYPGSLTLLKIKVYKCKFFFNLLRHAKCTYIFIKTTHCLCRFVPSPIPFSSFYFFGELYNFHRELVCHERHSFQHR